MMEKRPWADDELSPWAGEEDRPGVLEVARAYPGRAIGAAVGAMGMALVVTAFLMWGANSLWPSAFFKSDEANLVTWALLTAVFWWHLLNGEIRGWWTSGD